MPESIGKYQIIERIGRGGMGTIYKAHDPVLDRAVALKVISSEVEVTDELRARFFREAQACARLSHPNIVTVHDMGEDNGRLFIVMELLEGKELRRLIAEGQGLPIEDKLSIMAQVCDGLHYAHQRQIVHRDIKPGNIMLLPNGQVKILDFGVAQIATTEQGLTRTGLIMGTLRYIAPEQLRGRADHRSDIFSVGAVSYELLSGRPPFAGQDMIQILDQIRTEDPPPLNQLDSSIPAGLAAIVERAMRKDPEERFPDLAQMRTQLDQVQRELAEECRQARARLREQHDELRRLQRKLAERIGTSREDAVVSAPDERARLATLHALERDLIGRIETLRARIARADALVPALREATELLRAGHPADAVARLEQIVAEMPDHARALEALAPARIEAEAERRRQLAAKLVQDARAALADGGHALCLVLLKQAVEIPAPADAAPMIASLRETAEAALAAQEAARLAWPQAEQARDRMAQARRAAQAWAASQYAPALWSDAEAQCAEAQDAFAREAYDDASRAFDSAAALYRQSEERVHDAVRAIEISRAVSEAPELPGSVSQNAEHMALRENTTPSAQPVQPEPPSELAHAPTAVSETTFLADTLPALTDPDRESAHGSRDATRFMDAAQRDAPRAPAPPRAARPRTLRTHGIVIALGGLAAVIVLAILYWLPRAEPPGPPKDAGARQTAEGPGTPGQRSEPVPPPPPADKQQDVPRQLGSLAITSKVAGVSVWLHDQKIGETRSGHALITNDLAVGTYRLKASKAGYRDWEREVTIAADQRGDIVIDLEPLAPAKTVKGEDGGVMVLVPAGEFWMGSDEAEVDRAIEACKRDRYTEARCKDYFEPEAGRHRVVLDAFYIDRFEVTNARFERFVRSTGHETTAQRAGHGSVWSTDGKRHFVKINGAQWREPNGPGSSNAQDHPVVQVSWYDADAYCRWAGKRLPTEAEWEKAARGTSYHRYPWGESWDPSKANGQMAVRTTMPVGSYSGGVSQYGIHDMAGNVVEWVADWFDPTYYQRSPERNPRGPDVGSYRVTRGGSWINGPTWLRASHRIRANSDGRSDVLGFRCARGL